MRPCHSVWVAVLSLAACREDQEDPGALIDVDACAVDGVEECERNFGDRDLTVKVEQRINVTNRSVTTPLRLLDMTLIGDPAFRIESAPDELAPLAEGDIVVSVRPNVESHLETELHLLSDASNGQQLGDDDGDSVVIVAMSVNGVNNGIPDIDVTPAACTLDDETPSCDVRIVNTGNRDLIVDGMQLDCGGDDPATCAFVIEPPSIAPGFVIAPQNDDGAVITLTRTRADAAGSGVLRVLSSDPDESGVEVVVTVAP